MEKELNLVQCVCKKPINTNEVLEHGTSCTSFVQIFTPFIKDLREHLSKNKNDRTIMTIYKILLQEYIKKIEAKFPAPTTVVT